MPLNALALHKKDLTKLHTGSMMLLRRFQLGPKNICTLQPGSVICDFVHIDSLQKNVHCKQAILWFYVTSTWIHKKKYLYVPSIRQYFASKWCNWISQKKKTVRCKQAVLIYFYAFELHKKNICRWETGSIIILRSFCFTEKIFVHCKQAVLIMLLNALGLHKKNICRL